VTTYTLLSLPVAGQQEGVERIRGVISDPSTHILS
jgi:hypothetical protein